MGAERHTISGHSPQDTRTLPLYASAGLLSGSRLLYDIDYYDDDKGVHTQRLMSGWVGVVIQSAAAD